jgi:integrase
MVRVRTQRQRIAGKQQLRDLKTESSRRDINLPPMLVAQLRARRIPQAEERLPHPRWQDWNLIFPSTVGTPLDTQNLTKRFKTLLAKADLPDMRFHGLRHSCATLLFAQGCRSAGCSGPSATARPA